MRVLFLTDSLSDLDGVGRYTIRLVQALTELEPDLEPRFLLSRKHRPTSAEVPAHWPIEIGLPPDYFFHMRPARYWPNWAMGAWSVARASRGVDLVHAIKDYPHSAVGLVGARWAHKPCVATAHGTYSVQPLLDARHAARARRAYGGFAALISVSRYTARLLRKHLSEQELPSSRLHVIPNAVDARHYRERRELGARPWHGVPFTLSIGELKERKGHHLALEAWCRVAAGHGELEHFVVGKVSDATCKARLDALIERAGMGARVHFLGNVEEVDKIDLLQRARVFVHTPVTSADGGFEGFGIVYLEAAACGTPAIGTADSGAEDAIVDGQSGRLVAQTPEAVARALEELLAEGPLRERIVRGAREHAERSSWLDNARRVLAIYRGALETR